MILNTPLGEVAIYFDDELVDFKCMAIQDAWENVEHTYYLEYDYIADNASHKLSIHLDNDSIESGIESGEHFESIAFYGDTIKMNIGTKGDFGCPEEGNWDYDGTYFNNKIEIQISKDTTSKTFIFGVAWIVNYTDKNEHLPWYAAEPTAPREI